MSQARKKTKQCIKKHSKAIVMSVVMVVAASFAGVVTAVAEGASSVSSDEIFLGEKVKEVGANIAHQAYDEIAELVKVIPQLCEEVKGLAFKFLPTASLLSNNEDMKSSIENYERLVMKGHEVIDKLFSTDQTGFFTAEVKANTPMNDFAMGMLPLPGGLCNLFSNTNKWIENSKILESVKKARRSLTKERHLLPQPATTYQQSRNLEEIIDIYAPGIGGVRYNIAGELVAGELVAGELIGFWEP